MAIPAAPDAVPPPFAAISREVADDMAAIFGSSERRAITADGPMPESDGRGWPRAATLAIVAGLVLAIVSVLGVIAGRVVGSTPTVAPSPTASARHLVSPPVAPAAVAAPEIASAVDVPHDDALPPPPPRYAPRAAATTAPSPPSEVREAPPVVAQPAPPPVAAPVAEVRPVAPPTNPADCDFDTDDCLDARLAVADRRVSRALDRAAQAGVRPRDLRDYAGERDRARRAADVQPLDALRIYGLIESDLYTLADRAAARDDARR